MGPGAASVAEDPPPTGSSRSTRDALLEQGALLFARFGARGVSARALHEAAGTRNESALHYHFGNQEGLLTEILRLHLAEVEARRKPLVEALRAGGRTPPLRELVRALAAPMADDLATPVGRAHLRLLAEVNHPSLGYERPFPDAESRLDTDASAGAQVVAWLQEALRALPAEVRPERFAALRTQLIGMVGARAQLLDDDPRLQTPEATRLFVENLLDMTVAALTVLPSPEALDAAAAADALAPRRRPRRR